MMGVPKGEEEEREIEDLFEQTMKENFLNLSKGNRLPGSPGSSDSPKEVVPKEAHNKVHHNYITQD